jgi:dihydroflavonol-4-reductase
MSEMTVLVTGANGLLATNTIIELLSQGYRIVGLLRDKRKFLLPAHIYLELIEGDLLDEELLDHAVQKCDCVIHIAAETRQSLINYNEYYNINVVCTERLIKAALKYKLKRFVFVSTANTIVMEH